MKKIRMAVIGLGNRGYNVMKDVILNVPGFEVTAVCDVYEDRNDRAAEAVVAAGGKKPFASTDYTAILSREDVDAVYVASSWETHIRISIEAMKAGKAVAMEVGGACDLQECYDLVHAYETTRVPFMMMENCCFGKDELLATAMVRDGVLGEVVHCRGAYAHDLRDEITGGNKNRHYRLRHYHFRNAENYPTHELGPIAKLLNINRTNRMVSLVSVASKAAGLRDYIKDRGEAVDPTVRDFTFAQGDIVTTLIKCAGGQTIQLSLDTTLPRFYSREFTVRGTRGLYEAPTGSVFMDHDEEFFDTQKWYRENIGNAVKFEETYLPEEWKKITPEEMELGHGGIDLLEFRAFYKCLSEGLPMPVDVYDAASWMCITALSEQSIATGEPVAIPDFTNGEWVGREPADVTFLPKKVK